MQTPGIIEQKIPGVFSMAKGFGAGVLLAERFAKREGEHLSEIYKSSLKPLDLQFKQDYYYLALALGMCEC